MHSILSVGLCERTFFIKKISALHSHPYILYIPYTPYIP